MMFYCTEHQMFIFITAYNCLFLCLQIKLFIYTYFEMILYAEANYYVLRLFN